VEPRLETLTARGPGAIAVLRLAGPGAEAALRTAFRPRRARFERGRVYVGEIADADEVVLTPVGGGAFEVCGHGGAGAAARLTRALGTRPPRAAPVPELATARTWLAFRVLSWREEGLLDARWERAIDALARPRRVVLAGAPNAGKSALFNALLERERSIVSPEPGTTRDLIEEPCALEGVPLVLCDAAGLRDAADELEAEGAARARKAVAEADLVLHVVDRSAPRGDLRFASDLNVDSNLKQSSDSLVVLTKSDLPRAVEIPGALEVSALTGAGLDALALAIATHLLGRDPRAISRPAGEERAEAGRRAACSPCPPRAPAERPEAPA
jgi:small GTP-binding protein